VPELWAPTLPPLEPPMSWSAGSHSIASDPVPSGDIAFGSRGRRVETDLDSTAPAMVAGDDAVADDPYRSPFAGMPFDDPIGDPNEPHAPRHSVAADDSRSVLSSLGISAGGAGGGRRRARDDAAAETVHEPEPDAIPPRRTVSFDDISFLEPMLPPSLPYRPASWETESPIYAEASRDEEPLFRDSREFLSRDRTSDEPQPQDAPTEEKQEPVSRTLSEFPLSRNVLPDPMPFAIPVVPAQHSPFPDRPSAPLPAPAAATEDEPTEPVREAAAKATQPDPPAEPRRETPTVRTGRRRRSVQLADLLTEALMAYQTAQDANDARSNPLGPDPSPSLPGPTSLPEPLAGSIGRDTSIGDRPGGYAARPSDTRFGDSRWLTTRWDPSSDRP
jgi:hypothetical protein